MFNTFVLLQYGALRRKIGGTYKDFFKSYVEGRLYITILFGKMMMILFVLNI